MECHICHVQHPFVRDLDGEALDKAVAITVESPNIERFSASDCLILWDVLKKRSIQKIIRESSGDAGWKLVLAAIADKHHKRMHNKSFQSALDIEKARVTFRQLKTLRAMRNHRNIASKVIVLGETARIPIDNLSMVLLSKRLSQMAYEKTAKSRLTQGRTHLLSEVMEEVQRATKEAQDYTAKMSQTFQMISAPPQNDAKNPFEQITDYYGAKDIDVAKKKMKFPPVFKEKGQIIIHTYSDMIKQGLLEFVENEDHTRLEPGNGCCNLGCCFGCCSASSRPSGGSLWCLLAMGALCCQDKTNRFQMTFLHNLNFVFNTTEKPNIVRMDIVAKKMSDNGGIISDLLCRHNWNLRELDSAPRSVVVHYDPKGDAVAINEPVTFKFNTDNMLDSLLSLKTTQSDINFDPHFDNRFLKGP